LRFSLNNLPFLLEATAGMDTLLPLDLLRSGEWADVAEVTGEPSLVGRLAEMGVRTGCRLQMLQSGCPCMFQAGGRRLSLRGECCMQIMVRRLPVAG
jgi:ferrous iron transport protein A